MPNKGYMLPISIPLQSGMIEIAMADVPVLGRYAMLGAKKKREIRS
jgi:hypothetical protein